jgi:hypothetical protein
MNDSQSYFKDKERPTHQKALVGSMVAFPNLYISKTRLFNPLTVSKQTNDHLIILDLLLVP